MVGDRAVCPLCGDKNRPVSFAAIQTHEVKHLGQPWLSDYENRCAARTGHEVEAWDLPVLIVPEEQDQQSHHFFCPLSSIGSRHLYLHS